MALKYFVVNDVLFRTIDIRQDNFEGRSGESTIETTYLENIIEALVSSTNTTSTLIPGATDSAKLATLKGWWTVGSGDIRQQTARNAVNEEAPLRSTTVTDLTASQSGTVHQLSYRYILPEDLWEAAYQTITDNDNSNRIRAIDKNTLKSFCIRHDDIIKHPTEAAARSAYNAHTLKQLIDENDDTIDANYLKSASNVSD